MGAGSGGHTLASRAFVAAAISAGIRSNDDFNGVTQEPLVVGLKIIRQIYQTSPFKEHVRAETLPGPTCETDHDFEQYIREQSQTMYHPVGT